VVSGRTCLVTGGAGFIGCAISAGLAGRFDRVVAMDVLHGQVHKTARRPDCLHPDVELMQLDITEPRSWDVVLSDCRPDAVVHLAAETGTGQSLTEAARHAHVNVTGTAVMLDAFARHQHIPDRILLASSRAVYGDGAWIDPASGDIVYPGTRSRAQLAGGAWDYGSLHALPSCAATTKASPTSVYGATKLTQEHILQAWCAAFGAAPVVVRLQNVYGPGQSLSNPYTGIVALFCRLARAGKSIPLYEDGRMLRDFVLIDDAVSGLLASLDARPGSRDAFDIGTGTARAIAEIGAQIAALYDAPTPHVSGQYRFGDVRHASCRIDAAARDLDWYPLFPLSLGLQRLQKWIETQFEIEADMLS
jgi:dTDP-L-rhamnose 4-epimerase